MHDLDPIHLSAAESSFKKYVFQKLYLYQWFYIFIKGGNHDVQST